MGGRISSRSRKAERRDEAKVRQAAYDKLSLEEKLDRAEKRGGSTKEQKRLQIKIDQRDAAKKRAEAKAKKKEQASK